MEKQKDIDDLSEKYYHSMASALALEGDLEEAVVLLQRAIDVRDTPYAWHCLAGVLRETGDLAGAVGAMSRAVKLAPNVPEYYYERGLLLRGLGRPDLAGEDLRRAVALDGNYERIDRILKAADIVERSLCGKDVPGDIMEAGAGNEDLALVLEKVRPVQRGSEIFLKPSCPVGACPAYCCHFTGRLLNHGVTIGPWKLNALRRHFAEKNIAENDVLEVFSVERVEHAESLFAPQDIMKHTGKRSVFFPRQRDHCLAAGLVGDIPKGRDYRTLMWIDGSARPCVFLEDGRCSIYDVGGEPGLEPCASFLCMTGFVFVVLGHLGLTDGAMLAGRTMRELNGMAVDALIVLADDVYGNEEVLTSERADLDELTAAIEADRPGDRALSEAALARYSLLDRKHQALKDACMEKARQRIMRLFSPDRS